MLEKIHVLREKMEEQLLNNAPYEEVLLTSRQIDKLIVFYYKNIKSFSGIKN